MRETKRQTDIEKQRRQTGIHRLWTHTVAIVNRVRIKGIDRSRIAERMKQISYQVLRSLLPVARLK